MNYFKTAWRNIKKRKGFSLINVGGLALGMTSCMMLLLYVRHHWGYDRQFSNIDNIYIIENNQEGDGKIFTFGSTPRQLAGAIKDEVPGVEHTARTMAYRAGGLVSYQEKAVKKQGLYADAALFSIFDYRFIQGDPLTALNKPNTVIISEDLASVLFGKEDPMNKIIRRNGKTDLMVTGVIRNVPATASLQFDFVLPWVMAESEQTWIKQTNWGSNFCQTFILLKDRQYFAQADRLIRKMINAHQDGYKAEAFLFPFSRFHLWSKFENGVSVGGMIDQIRQFLILAVCILLVACVNFMNLSTARSEERAREVGIRKSIGSSKSSLIRQFIGESVILAAIAMLISMVLLYMLLPLFNRMLHLQLSVPSGQWQFWAGLIVITLLTGIISGSYPAFYLSSFKPVNVLKGSFKKSGAGTFSLRKVLIVVQFGFAVFLITATLCVYRQINFIKDRPVGYDRRNLIEIPAEGELGQKTGVFISEVQKSGAAVAATSLSQSLTQNGNNTWGIEWPGKDPNQKILFDTFQAGTDFTAATGIELTAGREFSEYAVSDTNVPPVAMINETAAKIMNLTNPVGAVIKWGDEPYTVIGVFKDFVWGSPYEKVPPMFATYSNNEGTVITLRLNPDKSISSGMQTIQSILKRMNPAFPPEIKFIDEDFEKKFENERLLGILANLFGGLAIIISCMGLFGLAAYAAERRTKEIGIRKVLGASVKGITALLSKDFLLLVAVAIVIAVPLSWWSLSRWLENYEYHISLNPGMFLAAGLITILIALLTVSFQAVKAAMANPVKSLRSE